MNITILFRFAILFEILWGAHAWFTWSIDNSRIMQYATYCIVVLIANNYKRKKRIHLNSTPAVVFGFTCYIIGVMFFNRFSIPSLVGVCMTLYVIWVTLSDKENVDGHLEFICKGLAWIFIPGILLFVITRYTALPGFIIQKGSSEDYIFINQIFLLQRVSGFDESADRFHSIFLEPGFIGSMLSFLLFAIKYNFSKWYNKVLLVALLFSLSLAGYMMTFIGYIIYLLVEGKSFKKIVVFSILISIVYIVSIEYNNGDNLVNRSIIERLQPDEEKGIAGNNRTGSGTEFYYQQAIKNGSIWMGLGIEKVNKINAGSSSSAGYDTNIRGAGYKVYFVTRGIISALFFLAFYYFMAKACNKRIMLQISAAIFVVIMFIPQSTPQSFAWIFPYILGMLNYNNNKMLKR